MVTKGLSLPQNVPRSGQSGAGMEAGERAGEALSWQLADILGTGVDIFNGKWMCKWEVGAEGECVGLRSPRSLWLRIQVRQRMGVTRMLLTGELGWGEAFGDGLRSLSSGEGC